MHVSSKIQLAEVRQPANATGWYCWAVVLHEYARTDYEMQRTTRYTPLALGWRRGERRSTSAHGEFSGDVRLSNLCYKYR
jgi:hypothetical protein